MILRTLALIILNIFFIFSFWQALGIPEPTAVLCCGEWDSQGNCRGTLMTPEEYRRHCRTQSTSSYSSPSGRLSVEQQLQLQMFQSVFAPLFNAIGRSLGELFMPDSNRSHLQRQQEEAKRKAVEAWQKHLEEAERQAKIEIERRKAAGEDILSKVRIGEGPFGSYAIVPRVSGTQASLSSIDWDNPRPTAISPGASQVTSESAKEQLLRTAYFSKMAEVAMLNGDLEAARFWAEIAFEGSSSSPIAINYNPPKELLDAMDSSKVKELNEKLSMYSSFFRSVIPKIEALQNISVKIKEINTKKEELKNKIKEVEEQIKSLEIKDKKVQAKEEQDKSDDLLAKALSLKQQAEAQLQNVLKEEQKFLQDKDRLEKELSELRNNLVKGN